MSPQLRAFLLWAPRVTGLAAGLFFALFASGSFDGRPLAETLPDVAMNLIPAAVVLTAVAAGWRHPWFGAVVFATLAIGYSALTARRLDWILVIAGPLAITAALFMLSALNAGRAAAPRS